MRNNYKILCQTVYDTCMTTHALIKGSLCAFLLLAMGTTSYSQIAGCVADYAIDVTAGVVTVGTADLNDGTSTNNLYINAIGTTSYVVGCADYQTVTLTLISSTTTDASGSTATCEVEITVEETNNPTATCVGSFGPVNVGTTVVPSDLNNGSSDACSGLSSTMTVNGSADLTVDCADIGPLVLTLGVEDEEGNPASCIVNVTVVDATAPTAVCAAYTHDLSDGTTFAASDVGTPTDACIDSETVSPNTAACSDVGTPFMVTYTVTDEGGTSAQCTAMVTVMDDVDPSITCNSGTLNVFLDGTGMASISTADIIASSSDACITTTESLSQEDFTCADAGNTITVTATVTDGSTNTATCTRMVAVMDTQAPTASCQDVTLNLSGGSATLNTTDVDNGSSDNCSFGSALDMTAFDCTHVGSSTLVTLTVTDASGTSAGCSANVTVEDNDAPTIICQDITINLAAFNMATITPTDIDNGSSDDCGIISRVLDVSTFGCAELGANTVELTVTDNNTNSTACTATVTVLENTAAPVAVCQNITVDVDDVLVPSDVDGGSTGDCGLLPNNVVPSSFDCNDFDAGTALVTLVVMDGSGSTSTCQSTVTVTNNVTIMAECKDIMLNLDGTGSATIDHTNIDDGSSTVENTYCGTLMYTTSPSPASFSCADIGAQSVTLIVTDSNNASNVSSCVSTVTVADNTAPTAMCQDITVSLDGSGNVTVVAGDIDDGSSDGCGGVGLSIPSTNYDCSHLGNGNMITLTVTDGSTNTATCTSTVTVEESNAPVAVCQDITVNIVAGSGSATAAAINNASYDGCTAMGDLVLSIPTSTYDCTDAGTTATVTLTVTDDSSNSNSSTCDSTVSIEDNESPVITCHTTAIDIYLDASGFATVDYTDLLLTHTDNCSISSYFYTGPTAFTCANEGSTYTIGVDAVDGSGNSTATNSDGCTTDVNIIDNLPPAITCQDITISVGNTAYAGAFLAASSDGCGIADTAFDSGYTDDNDYYDCNSAGTYPYTIYVIDNNDLESNCTATLTVESNPTPFVNCYSSPTVYLPATTGTANIPAPSNWASWGDSNCGGTTLSVSLSQATFDCSDDYYFNGNNYVQVTITVSDNLGNSASDDCRFYVYDMTVPELDICPPLTAANIVEVVLDPVTLEAELNANEIAAAAGITLVSNVCNNHYFTWEDYYDDAVNRNDCEDYPLATDYLYDDNDVIHYQDMDCDDEGEIFIATLVPTWDYDGQERGNYIDNNGCDYYDNYCAVYIKIVSAAPAANCKASTITVSLDPDGTVTVPGSLIDDGSSDDCSNFYSVLSPGDFDCSHIGTAQTVTLTVYDDSGNSASCTGSVMVEDNDAPSVSCNDVLVELDAAGMGSVVAADFDLLGLTMDGCGITSSVITSATFDLSTIDCSSITGNLNYTTYAYQLDRTETYAPLTGTATVTDDGQIIPIGFDFEFYGMVWTSLVFDDFGVARFGTTTSNLYDSTPDQISDGDNYPGLALFWGGDFDDDNNTSIEYFVTGTAPNQIFVLDFSTSDTNDGYYADVQLQLYESTGEIQMHYTTLENGNNDDISAGVFTNDNGNSSYTGTADLDDVSLNGVIKTNEATSYLPQEIHNVTGEAVILTVTDNYNNSSTATCDIAVVDNIAPVVTCQDITVQMDQSLVASWNQDDLFVSSSDNCASPPTLYTVSSTYNGCVNAGMVSTTTIAVTDGNGNSGTDACDVTIQGPPPVATCQDLTIGLDGNGMATLDPETDLDNGSYDNCDASLDADVLVYAASAVSFDCTNLGTPVMVTLTVTDNDGFSATDECEVTLTDFVAPMPVCATNIEVQLDAVDGNYVLSAADVDGASYDNCSYVASIPATEYTCTDVGIQSVDLTVTDPSGGAQAISCDVEVTSPDPVAACVDITVTLVGGMYSLTTADLNNMVSESNDVCGTALSLSSDITDLTCTSGNGGVVAIVVTVDNGTSTDDCTSNVTIYSAPSAVCQDRTVMLGLNDEVTITAAEIDGGSSSDCGVLSVGISSAQTTFGCDDVGMTIPVTLSVSDGISASSCDANVTIELDPTLPCQCIPDYRIATDNPIPDPVPDGYYPTIIDIETDALVPSSGAVEFKAGNSILMLPGFEVKGNTVFLAHIGPCP